jgi:hypothetical protein
MNITRLFITLTACCAFAFSSNAASNTNGGGTGEETGKGMHEQQGVTELTGTVENYMKSDSMLIVRSAMDTMLMDTVKVMPTTNVTIQGQKKKASDLAKGKMVKVWYRMENGQKVATRVTETKMKKKSGTQHRGEMGHDTTRGTGGETGGGTGGGY